MKTLSRDQMEASQGSEIGVSKWFTVDQSQIDAFADVTADYQYIHIDPKRAAQTPFGGTIAHGFLSLSMLSAMSQDCVPRVEGVAMSVNYGFERIRFVSPVPVGARIRGRFVLDRFEELKPDQFTVTLNVTVEIDGNPKPALVATWIGRHYLGATGSATS